MSSAQITLFSISLHICRSCYKLLLIACSVNQFLPLWRVLGKSLCTPRQNFFFSIKKSNDAGCEGGPRGKDVCVHIADSLCCAEETNTTL